VIAGLVIQGTESIVRPPSLRVRSQRPGQILARSHSISERQGLQSHSFYRVDLRWLELDDPEKCVDGALRVIQPTGRCANPQPDVGRRFDVSRARVVDESALEISAPRCFVTSRQ
jgi:hypothetical protein